MSRMDSSTRILIGVVAGVILLVVLALTLPRVIDREETTYPPDTPEGTVQRYVRAAMDEDAGTALALLTEENTGPCVSEELRDDIDSGYSSFDRQRVRLGEVEEVDADTVIVNVGVTYVREPGFFELPNEGTVYEHEFEMERSRDGFWLIADAEWPVDLDYARERCADDE